MATWEDGPEFAPGQRPDAWDSKHVPALDAPPEEEHPAADAPTEPPHHWDAAQGVALDGIAPPAEPPRDPQRAFDVAAATMTHEVGTGWESAHRVHSGAADAAWQPQQPLAVTSAAMTAPPHPVAHPHPDHAAQPLAPTPQPGTPGWFAPVAQPVPQTHQPVTFATWWAAITPGVVLSLLLGLVPVVAPIALAGTFLLAFRIEHHRNIVLILLGVALAVVAVFSLATLPNTQGQLAGWWDGLGVMAAICNGGALVLASAAVWLGLRR